MKSWSSLPSELLQNILHFLTTKDVLQCQLVCHNWTKTAQQIIYRDVRLESEAQVALFIKTISCLDLSFGNYLRKLYIHYNYQDNESNNTFEYLTKYCPYLEDLELTTTNEMYWKRIKQEQEKGTWPYLNTLQCPSSKAEFKSYYETITAMCVTMKSIMLCDYFFFQYSAESVKQFRRAEKLAFIRSSELSLQELNTVIDALPSLTTLVLKLYSPMSAQPLERYDMSAVLPCSNLTRLDAFIFLGSENAFLYIMNKFPGLKRLDVNYPNAPLISPMYPAFSLSIIERLADYLNGLESFHIRQISFENMADFVLVAAKKMCKKRLQVDIAIDIQSNQIKLTNLDISCKHKDQAGEPSMNLLVRNKNRVLPLSTVLDKFGTLIKNLTIYNRGAPSIFFVEKGTNHLCIPHRHYLSDIFEGCPNMTELKLSEARLIGSDLKDTIVTSVHTLILNKCVYSPSVLRQLSTQLAFLKKMEVSCSEIIDPNTLLPLSTASHFFFDMPYTSFDTFEFTRLSVHAKHKYIFLKLSTVHGESFHKFNKKDGFSATEQEYEQSIGNHSVHTLHIVCKEIKYVQLSDFGHHVYHKVVQ
ncbi:uncharacterized protein B0P05DRAFT_559658 [Gilbertella persicaria]|uniref:uncharacterized protein n=1 Tax=Gilbertella persicaria TaxID=101096 RepID=UPI00221E62DA|nr:uncharacterized protein B0P05DRAFT_559658 [Gilbertella persicaria]KAI8057539.1 hypothetical protein B0P05DRAFT_559658 [Gilbertella persicaria]